MTWKESNNSCFSHYTLCLQKVYNPTFNDNFNTSGPIISPPALRGRGGGLVFRCSLFEYF